MSTLDFLNCCLPHLSAAAVQGSQGRVQAKYCCEVRDCSNRPKDESLNTVSQICNFRINLIQAWAAKKYCQSSDNGVRNSIYCPCQHLRLSPCKGRKKQSRVFSMFAAADSFEYAKSFLESHSQLGDRKAFIADYLQSFMQRTIKIFKVLKLKMQSFFDAFIVDRYLFREMLPPFLAALAICSTLGMSLGALVSLVREAVISGVPLRLAVAASVLQLPRFLSQMMPVACMMAVLFTFTQFQGDKELLALYSFGIPTWRLLFAPLCLGMLAGVLKLACHEYLVPFSNRRAQGMVESALTSHLHNCHAREDVIYSEYESSGIEATRKRLQRVWYAKRCDRGCMIGVLVLDISQRGDVRRVLIADACNWIPKEKTWQFRKSTILEILPLRPRHNIVQIGITASLSMSKAETMSVTHSTPLIVATLLGGLYNCMVALAAVVGYKGLVSPGVSAWLPCLLGLFLGLFSVLLF